MTAHGEVAATEAYTTLATTDPALGRLAGLYGTPDPFEFPDGGRTRDDNFAGMALHVIAQQISIKVALILYDRLVIATGGSPTPESVLALDIDQLRSIGTSRSKATYLRDLADAVSTGELNITDMAALSDEEAVAALTKVKGIGPWSAQMFLIHQLRRADILPAGDLGIRIAVARLDALAETPTIPATEQRGKRWAPYRTYASALLWHSLKPPA